MPPETEKFPYTDREQPNPIGEMTPERKAKFALFIRDNADMAKSLNQGQLLALFLAQERANEAGEEQEG